jgi:multiple sugar transport system ATP-binding protein
MLPHAGSAGLVGQPLVVGIRPEHVNIARDGGFPLTLTPNIIERLGIHTVTYAPLPNGENFIALFEGDPAIGEDEALSVSIDPNDCHLFGADGLAIARPQ